MSNYNHMPLVHKPYNIAQQLCKVSELNLYNGNITYVIAFIII